jgi:hypothetical protein
MLGHMEVGYKDFNVIKQAELLSSVILCDYCDEYFTFLMRNFYLAQQFIQLKE